MMSDVLNTILHASEDPVGAASTRFLRDGDRDTLFWRHKRAMRRSRFSEEQIISVLKEH